MLSNFERDTLCQALCVGSDTYGKLAHKKTTGPETLENKPETGTLTKHWSDDSSDTKLQHGRLGQCRRSRPLLFAHPMVPYMSSSNTTYAKGWPKRNRYSGNHRAISTTIQTPEGPTSLAGDLSRPRGVGGWDLPETPCSVHRHETQAQNKAPMAAPDGKRAHSTQSETASVR